MIKNHQFRPLRRMLGAAWLGGVCSGIAYSVGAPTWVIRLLWVFLTIAGMGWGVILYILLWAFVPVEQKLPPDYTQRTGDTGRI